MFTSPLKSEIIIVPVQAMKIYRRSGVIDPLILNIISLTLRSI